MNSTTGSNTRTFSTAYAGMNIHAWRLKCIRPNTFASLDLSREAYTRLLWVFDGFTTYYNTLELVRSGHMSEQEYVAALGKDLTRYLRTPGCQVQVLEEPSFDTWIKLYKPYENTPNSPISYYLKGSLVALAINLSLRAQVAFARRRHAGAMEQLQAWRTRG